MDAPPAVKSLCEAAAACDCVGKHVAIGLFKGRANGETAGQAGEFDRKLGETFGDKDCRGISFDVRRRAEDHFTELSVADTGGERVE